MHYYSTSHRASHVAFPDAVINSIAPDGGLYMPSEIPVIPRAFFNNFSEMSLQEISYVIANMLMGNDIESSALNEIVKNTLNFEMPLVEIEDNRYVLELFHGPTLAFKDIGARFMAGLLSYFAQQGKHGLHPGNVNVLVATTGDTGSAMAMAMHNVPGVRVFVLYPKGRLNNIQKAQFSTLGDNVQALEVKGDFDDCLNMVRLAFSDTELNSRINLTSANSINVARLLPQTFYYFYAIARMMHKGVDVDNLFVSVPCGHCGNLLAGLIAKRMGLPIKRFIAANNSNGALCQYIQSGSLEPVKTIPTMVSTMDVGSPSNLRRIDDFYGGDLSRLRSEVDAVSYSDDAIRNTLLRIYREKGYLLDPRGAVAYHALEDRCAKGMTGVSLAPAHPVKYLDTVQDIIGEKISIPSQLKPYLTASKAVESLPASYSALKNRLTASHN